MPIGSRAAMKDLSRKSTKTKENIPSSMPTTSSPTSSYCSSPANHHHHHPPNSFLSTTNSGHMQINIDVMTQSRAESGTSLREVVVCQDKFVRKRSLDRQIVIQEEELNIHVCGWQEPTRWAMTSQSLWVW